MRTIQRWGLAAVLCGAAIGLTVAVGAAEAPTVAVLDFVTADQPVDSALLGLGDLLEAELSGYGLNVISRRELNLLLGERRLAREGFTRIEDIQGATLPWADFLLRCEFRTEGRAEAWASLRLVDARTGREVKAWNLTATSPLAALEEIPHFVPGVAAAILQRPAKALPPRPTPGFTAIPEAARTFYHGLDHLVRGKPEYAAEYFRLAAADDTNFTFAVLGQAKAYEILGFSRVAEALRAAVPKGQLPEARIAGTGSVLTVRFVNRGGVFTPKTMDYFRGLLQGEHGFSLFEPDWIPALTRETDLKLTGEFPLLHGLDQRLWLQADHMLVFSAEAKQLRVDAIDLVRGQLLGTVTSSANDLDDLCRRAVAAIRNPAAAPSVAPLARVTSTNRPAATLNGTFTVDEIATALRSVADHPKDMACWGHLMVLIQGHPGYQRVFRAFVPSFEEAIPRDTPDTPVWLAAAGWMRYIYDAEQAGKPLPMEDYFTELLDRYPHHLQSSVVRYNAALRLGYLGDYTLSLPGVLAAITNVAEQVANLHDFVPFRGCRVDDISQLNYENFPIVLPPHGPRMTMLARGVYFSAVYLYREMGRLDQAELYLAKQRPLQGRILYGSEVYQHFAGPMTIFPTVIGLWQTGHIGYEWQPADPADVGRVLVGWTFLPYPLPGWKNVQGRFAEKVRAQQAPQGQSDAELMDRAAEQIDEREATEAAIRKVPGIAATGGIFLPQRPPAKSSFVLMRDNLESHLGSLEYAESKAGRTLTVADIAPDHPDDCMVVMGMFTRGTVDRLQSEGTKAGLKFALGFIESFLARRQELSFTWGVRRVDEHLAEMYWMTAGAQELSGDVAGARATYRMALTANLSDALVFSIRYMDARAAHRAGQDADAAAILRALIEDPKAKDTPLRLPEEARELGTVYAESADLLTAVHSGADDAATVKAALPAVAVDAVPAPTSQAPAPIEEPSGAKSEPPPALEISASPSQEAPAARPQTVVPAPEAVASPAVPSPPAPPVAVPRGTWGERIKTWVASVLPHADPQAADPHAAATVSTNRDTRSLEERAWADYLRDNPDLEQRLRAKYRQRKEAEQALRRSPGVARTKGIFLPQQRPAPSSLGLLRDTLATTLDYLAEIERQSGKTLTLADIAPADPEGFMLVMGLFARGTVQALQREGTEAGLRFACEFVETFAARRKEFSRPWGESTVEAELAELYWMTAGALEVTGDVSGARRTYARALAADLRHPLVPSIRYMNARAAHRVGQDFEASEILRALIEDTTSKDVPLRLPEEARELGTVYAESLARLEAIRHGEGAVDTMPPSLRRSAAW